VKIEAKDNTPACTSASRRSGPTCFPLRFYPGERADGEMPD
jgi:hypothetical protein